MTAPYLGRYTDLLPVRPRSSFQLMSARRIADGRSVTLVVPGPAADPNRVAAAFEAAHAAHDRIVHPRIPKVTACGHHGGTPFLELDCALVFDGVELLRLLGDAEQRIPYPAADAFIASLREAVCAAHAAIDPETGGPLCLGRFSAANVLFDATGKWWLVGFGRNWPVEKDDGTVDGTVSFLQAPELWSGAPPSPSGDYVALILFTRSVLPFVEVTGPIARVLLGQVGPGDQELVDLLRWVDRRMLGELPSLRATIDEAVANSNRIRELAGITLDEPGFLQHVTGLIRRIDDPARLDGDAPQGDLRLTLGPDAAWVAGPDGARYRLGRALRRLLNALVEHHGSRPECGLTTVELLEAGWPGEKPIHEAGTARVYVTVNRLRKMGLRDLIERYDDGYRLAPQVRVERTT